MSNPIKRKNNNVTTTLKKNVQMGKRYTHEYKSTKIQR